MLGLLMHIEGDEGDSEPPKGFDYDDAWYQSVVQAWQSRIHQSQGCLVAAQHMDWNKALGEISSTQMHEHKDMQIICSPLSDVSQHRFVQTAVKDSQIAQAIENLTDVIAAVNKNINLMRKSILMYQQNTNKILKLMADKILGRTPENEDLGERSAPDTQSDDSDETPLEEGKQHKDSENVFDEEEQNLDQLKEEEEKEEKKDEDDDDDDEMENDEEQDKDKELKDDAKEDLNQDEEEKGEDGSDRNQEEEIKQTSEEGERTSTEKAPSPAVDETNVSKASSETNSAEGGLTLATTEEVIAGLKPLASAPASPKGTGKATPPSHSTSSPTKRSSAVIKPKKKVTKKAATTTDEAPAQAT
ncbi:hypothetical protein CCACVL1_23476 [Corchorus capsularis]|uniref:Uncharacterized protein n=1 Tax=Corchorus capsularis TaxID=210143 RepID=A0A1R3GTT1_COCAP|nr:hypothetical protein CCACVL1_23476 [Corchorus capsularis]